MIVDRDIRHMENEQVKARGHACQLLTPGLKGMDLIVRYSCLFLLSVHMFRGATPDLIQNPVIGAMK